MDIKNKLTSLSEAQLQLRLKDLIAKAVNRLKQELSGECHDLLDRDLRTYRAKIARISSKVAQKWSKWNNDGPVLMPDYTRIYYRKGKTEVLLQEYPPQVRLLRFRGSLVSRPGTDIDRYPENSETAYSFSLALPYLVFIFRFVDGLFVELRCAFSDRPLKRLEERPLKPYLSNIDTELKVCLGSSLDRGALERNNVAQQAALVLDNFWQTIYTEDWSSHFWQSRRHFIELREKRLTTLPAWQQASIDNSLFVIEKVDWLKHKEETFGELFARMLDGDQEYNRFTEDLYKELAEGFVDQVKKTIEANFTTVEQKVLSTGVDQVLREVFGG